MTDILAKAVMAVTSITEAAPTNALTATVRCSVFALKVERFNVWQCFALVFCYALYTTQRHRSEQNIAGHEPLYLKDIRWRRTGRSAEIQMNVSQRMEAVSKCVLMNQVSALFYNR